ncbi:MAG TPA: MFS transporter [Steroidobacteraceae bacterium]|nr:MFS transporter [Steroidobacteraceae bacterium]
MSETAAPVLPQSLPSAGARRAAGVSTYVVLLLALAVLINYIDRGNLSIAAPRIQDELRLSSAQLGLLLSVFFWSYAPAQLLCGWLAHRYPVRNVLALGLTVWSLATVLSGLATGLGMLLALRLLLGLGESAFYPCNARLLAEGSPEHRRGGANGLVVAGQALGPTLGTLFGGLLMAHFGWRAVFVGLGVGSLLWLPPWLRATRGASAPPRASEVSAGISYRRILGQPSSWGSSAGSFLSFYGYYFLITWLPTYLVKARGFTLSEMARLGALIYLMHALSSPLVGWLSDRLIRGGASVERVRKSMLVIGSAGVAFTLPLCARAPTGSCIALLTLAAFAYGFVTPQIFAIPQTLGGVRAAGKWMALQNMVGNFAGVAAPWITGILVDRTGQYTLAFACASASAVLAALAWALGVRRLVPIDWDRPATAG